MLSVKVSTKHQIVVPSEARRALAIEPGDRLDVELTADAIILRRRPDRPSDRLRGLAVGRRMYEPDPVTFVRRLREESAARAREREELIGHAVARGTHPDRDR